MSRKLEITGVAVIYTPAGVKVVDAQVRRLFNANADELECKYNYDGENLYIGCARLAPKQNIYAAEPKPEHVAQMLNYAQSKFFRLILDLQRLAGWEPLDKFNYCFLSRTFHFNKPNSIDKKDMDIDFSGDIDAQLYEKYNFTPAMIRFTEDRYASIHEDENRRV